MLNQIAQSETPTDLLLIKSGKWDLVVVTRLETGPKRFNVLRAEIGGISQKVLASTLRDLERNGFVTRTQYASIPPRVDYDLTDLGRELLVAIGVLLEFVQTNRSTIIAAQQAFDHMHEKASAERNIA